MGLQIQCKSKRGRHVILRVENSTSQLEVKLWYERTSENTSLVGNLGHEGNKKVIDFKAGIFQ